MEDYLKNTWLDSNLKNGLKKYKISVLRSGNLQKLFQLRKRIYMRTYFIKTFAIFSSKLFPQRMHCFREIDKTKTKFAIWVVSKQNIVSSKLRSLDNTRYVLTPISVF